MTKRVPSKSPNGKRNDGDAKVEKLQNMNSKLTKKMKQLNQVLEITLDKANTKKQAKLNKEQHVIKSDANHQIKVKDGQLKNAKNQIEKYNKDIADMKKKLG